MNVIELMDASTSSYSKTDRAIYDSIRKFPDRYATQSVTRLSEETGFSKPALTRFAQRLGFGGFVEFQYQFVQDLDQTRQRTDKPTNAEVYGNLLRSVEERVDLRQLEALVDRMIEAPHVFTMGYNLSRFPAEQMSIAFTMETGIFSVSPQVDMLPPFDARDVAMVYSAATGSSYRDLMGSIKTGRVTKPYLVLVTTNPKHPLRRRFDEIIVLPTAALSSSGRAVLGDTFAFLMFNDLLTAVSSARWKACD